MLTPEFVNINSFFYPIGNTPAVSLAQSLPPKIPADILLLGCGDVRNILFTNHVDGREMDITCCDNQKAVIARNILLLSLIIDAEDVANNNSLWSIYYHMYIDRKSLDLLRAQAKRLHELSDTMDTWHRSKYGPFLRFCDSATLTSMNKMWEFYSMEQRGAEISRFKRRFESILREAAAKKPGRDGNALVLTGRRSAIPVNSEAILDVGALHQHYWKHGSTEMNAGIRATAKNPNPTFLTLKDEALVHYGTDPLLGFHLATAYAPLQPDNPVFNRIKDLPPLERVVMVARLEFYEWAASYRKNMTDVRLRFFVGDAISLSHTIQNRRATMSSTAHWYRDRYGFQRLELDGPDYAKFVAPLDFDVIDTSNLCDHVGSLVLLTATSPLLRHHASSVLYTEVIASHHQTDREVLDHMLCGHVPTLSTLLDLFPVEYWTNTSPVLNGDEKMFDEMTSRVSGKETTTPIRRQMFLRTWWKRPFCHTLSTGPRFGPKTIQFEANQLAEVLYRVYTYMFRDEDYANKFLNMSLDSFRKSSLLWYQRAGFASFLHLVKTRVTCDWDTAMGDLMILIQNRRNAPINAQYFQELYVYLHLLGTFSSDVLKSWHERGHDLASVLEGLLSCTPPVGRRLGDLRDWKNIPPVVCVTLKIPRAKLGVFTNIHRSEIGTPYVHCLLQSSEAPRQGSWQNLFQACQLGFGEISTQGTRHDDSFEISVVEDEAGWNGTSALIAVFYAPSFYLLMEPRDATVALGIHSTLITVHQFVSKVGIEMNVYKTTLNNSAAVYITRYGPNQKQFPASTGFFQNETANPDSIGANASMIANVDTNGGNIISFTGRFDITDDDRKLALQGGCQVQRSTVSPCEVSIQLGKIAPLNLSFPTIVVENSQKLRIARKSLYIEVVAQVAGPFEWMNYPHFMYPILLQDEKPANYNLPYLELQTCPIVDINQRTKLEWLNTHLSGMMSARERVLREQSGRLHSAGEQIRLDFKESLFSLFVRFSGIQGEKGRAFGINCAGHGGIHMLILPSSLRLDLTNRTVVLDCAVLPLYDELMPRLPRSLSSLNEQGVVPINVNAAELQLWRRVLPTFVERCRTWTHKANCEYATSGAIPLAMENGTQLLCSCGNGNFPPNFIRNVSGWKTLAKYAVRAAISPAFWAPFADDVYCPDMSGDAIATGAGASSGEGCQSCGKDKQEDGSGLLNCTGCRKVKYCSRECQRADWKKHKPVCG
ncbi:hypothetical protein F4825DRAFT_469448 [Nemania diffusa]|nr:hypothetical protein F4825DRAFT_469448 [Nemania diffusa]